MSAPPRVFRLKVGDQTVGIRVRCRPGDRLTINVHPDQSVTALVPYGQPWDRVADRLRTRSSWIGKQLRHFEQFKPAPVSRQYVSGETLLYLGRQYRLRVRKGATPSAKLIGQFLLVESLNPADRGATRMLVQRWYAHRAAEVLARRLDAAVAVTTSLKLPPPELRLRRMRTRWGSCTKAGTVLLHPDLVLVPSQCIDYVLVHELCHRKVLRHDARFYALLQRYMPDWRRRKERLNEFVISDGAAR